VIGWSVLPNQSSDDREMDESSNLTGECRKLATVSASHLHRGLHSKRNDGVQSLAASIPKLMYGHGLSYDMF